MKNNNVVIVQNEATTKELIISLALGIIIALFITRIVIFTTVIGHSMHPTYNDKDIIIVNVLNKKPKNGDIVIFKLNNHNEDLIKRVMAIEGDYLEIREGQIYINNTKIDEPYIKSKWNYGNYSGTIPKGYMYVMGDNRDASYDSRDIGLININSIKGKVILKIYYFKHKYTTFILCLC